jgi:two-component system NtrC family sensor kinase
MPILKFNGRFSFQAKVLMPVIALLVLLPSIMLLIVHRSSMSQLEKDARQKLMTADAVFKHFIKIRHNHLLSRFKNTAADPRLRAIGKLEDPKTMNSRLHEMLAEELGEDAEFIIYVTADGKLLAEASRDSGAKTKDFELAAQNAVEHALQGTPDSKVIPLNSKLFNVIAVPVFAQEMLVGALGVGVRVSEATLQELNSITRAEVVLLVNNAASASTLRGYEYQPGTLPKWKDSDEPVENEVGVPVQVNLAHYMAWASRFPDSPLESDVGYVLLASYEAALIQVRETQATLLLVSSIGIGISAIVIWFVIGLISAPLRVLRNSAEAVGAGDFTQRIPINSNDEFAQLAQSFNQMTRNLQQSHSELQKTVETLKATQAQLIQSEKLSAVGEFVAGVAHELNNPLTSVIGFAELLKTANLQGKHLNFLNYIVKSSERCQKIVQGLLSFARQSPPEKKPVSPNEMLDGVLEILAYELRTSNIEIERNFQRNLPKVLGDSHQLQQVFLNILNNARQAMESNQATGRIRISTETAASRIRITFEDNGPGIKEENLAKIFDPFFTTKSVGKGTGLGLSLCYGIVNEHSGHIAAHSEPGQGATFIIDLPIHHEKIIENLSTGVEGSDHDTNFGIGRKVLVVDDEEWILELVAQILKRDGFQVDTAKDGHSALDQIARSHYQLLVCDWKMPGLSGTQLYERITHVNPTTAERVIFMTGDVMSDTFQSFLKQNRKTCLSKPFSVQEFRQTINSFVASRN